MHVAPFTLVSQSIMFKKIKISVGKTPFQAPWMDHKYMRVDENTLRRVV